MNTVTLDTNVIDNEKVIKAAQAAGPQLRMTQPADSG
jgi:hypothetical protein